MTSTTEQDTRPDMHEMHVRREAVDVIAACQERVNALGRYFGESSKYYQEAEQSFRHNLSLLFRMFFGGECWITKDGELSLFVQTNSKFVFGMIFHEVRRSCTLDGCKAYAHADGSVFHYGMWNDTGILDHEHAWSIPLDAPMPGTWSFHS